MSYPHTAGFGKHTPQCPGQHEPCRFGKHKVRRAVRPGAARVFPGLSSILTALLLFFSVTFSAASPAYAAVPWPSEILVEAEGAALIDAGSGCFLYGKNLHERFYPASITKVLTALLIIENCDLDDTVTFSHSAVYDVEAGSTNAGYDTGDQITVRQALYAMLVKSANEVANALAEHCSGSVEEFAELMNRRAASLGCSDSHFMNPSGLNDPDHYTTAYDFALISRAAFANPTFVEFDSATYYELPANARNPEAFTVYCGHKMLKKNSQLYYPGIIGGKTGYTSLAGNTLVTCAERNDLRLITVILNGHQTHYSDTKTLLDFGFDNFRSVSISGRNTPYSAIQDSIHLTGTGTSFQVADGCSATLPEGMELGDADVQVIYELTDADPENAIARIEYRTEDRLIGNTWLIAGENAAGAGAAGAGGAAGNTNISGASGGTAAGAAGAAGIGTADTAGVSAGAVSADGTAGTVSPGSAAGTAADGKKKLRLPLPVSVIAPLLAAVAALILAAILLVRRAKRLQKEAEATISETLRRQNLMHEGPADILFEDSAASVHSYLKDTRDNPAKKAGVHFPFFHRKQ